MYVWLHGTETPAGCRKREFQLAFSARALIEYPLKWQIRMGAVDTVALRTGEIGGNRSANPARLYKAFWLGNLVSSASEAK